MNISKPVALIDLSSYVFYRFFAVQRWTKFSGKDLSEEELLAKFDDMFVSNLLAIKKKLKLDWKNVVLARDCPRNDIWRHSIFDGYKGTRDEKRPASFAPAAFSRSYNTLIPKLKEEWGFHVALYDEAEGDDVIAVMKQEIRKRAPSTPIYVISADTDFIQLKDEHTRVLNFTMKDIDTAMNDEKKEHYLLWKIIRGDVSDNIPAIDKKIGDVTALKLAKDPVALEARLAKSSEVRERFELNRRLIDFEFIPITIRCGVVALLEQMLPTRS